MSDAGDRYRAAEDGRQHWDTSLGGAEIRMRAGEADDPAERLPWDAVDACGGSRPAQTTRKSLRMAANGSQSRFRRPGWDDWAMGIAEAVSRRADCTRRQVGAVILDPEHRIVATGYNGYPSGAPGCATSGACPRGRFTHDEIPPDSPYVGTPSPCSAIHAEENAVLHARTPLAGCTVYVTDKPCPNCQRFLAGTGIVRAVWPDGAIGFGIEHR